MPANAQLRASLGIAAAARSCRHAVNRSKLPVRITHHTHDGRANVRLSVADAAHHNRRTTIRFIKVFRC